MRISIWAYSHPLTRLRKDDTRNTNPKYVLLHIITTTEHTNKKRTNRIFPSNTQTSSHYSPPLFAYLTVHCWWSSRLQLARKHLATKFKDELRFIEHPMYIKNSMHFQPSLRISGRDKDNRIIGDHWKYMSNQAIIVRIIAWHLL